VLIVRSPVVAKKSAKRRVLVLLLIFVGLIAIIVGVIGRPQSNLASSLLTERVTKGDVAITVSASGTLVDRYTYALAPEAPAVLTQIAGVDVGTGANAVGYHTTGVGAAPGDAIVAGQELFEVQDKDDNVFAVTSPVDGTVRSVSTTVGAAASQVATIGAGGVIVSVQVSEHDVARLSIGQTVALTLGATKETFTGTVSIVGSLATSTTGVQQYQVLVAANSLPADARIGMTVTGSIEISSAKGVLNVAASAITTVNKQSTVKVLENGRLRLATVTLGVVGDSRVEIKSGLTEGDIVVTGSSGTVPVVSNTGRFGQGGGN
jgi:multidrug efflux pump subunit AcrA (membrane-fusion protein)